MPKKWGSGFTRQVRRYRVIHHPKHLHFWMFSPQKVEGVAMPYGVANCRCGKVRWVANIDAAKNSQSKRLDVWRNGGLI